LVYDFVQHNWSIELDTSHARLDVELVAALC